MRLEILQGSWKVLSNSGSNLHLIPDLLISGFLPYLPLRPPVSHCDFQETSMMTMLYSFRKRYLCGRQLFPFSYMTNFRVETRLWSLDLPHGILLDHSFHHNLVQINLTAFNFSSSMPLKTQDTFSSVFCIGLCSLVASSLPPARKALYKASATSEQRL